ncbi:MAG TPA: ATP-binding protein [Acidisarcina sp.]
MSCAICNGLGMQVRTGADGEQIARECICREAERAELLLRRAKIPKRYEHCTLENFELDFVTDTVLPVARATAQSFVREYPVGTEGKGLLLIGAIGVGKTHLAVGMLRDLITTKGVRGLFCDYRELLKEVQHSYNAEALTTELAVLAPVFEAEVLVLDELGAAKPTEWVWDTVAHILNTRYNDKRTTIITTNYPDSAPGAGGGRDTVAGRAMRDETLGDRIGERMRSRLAEMCVVVEMRGEDFRRGVGRARFG